QAAQFIAARHPSLDPDIAYRFGLLHDIGRRVGVTDMRHALDGYIYLCSRGFPRAARICLTHSFPVKDVRAGSGGWDCADHELRFVADFLSSIEYDDYDRLLQIADALATSTGFCLLEKRLVDVALRRGTNAFTLAKWRAYMQLIEEFEVVIGSSIYSLLPGIVSSTFGFDTSTAP
ncbi:MAG: HD domain-containing protein, partial [Chloroflexi bacterium]